MCVCVSVEGGIKKDQWEKYNLLRTKRRTVTVESNLHNCGKYQEVCRFSETLQSSLLHLRKISQRFFISRLRLGGTSLHDRRFISQAGRTRYFARSATWARSARRGEEKNKAPVRSPLLLLFRQCSTVHQVDGHAYWSISTTWWWHSVIKLSKQKWRPWVWKKR